MTSTLIGNWHLTQWRRIDSAGNITFPLGADASGILIYSADGSMAVQMTAAKRPNIATTNALNGSMEEQAAAYSTCLAYFGTYEVDDGSVIHKIDKSLFPNWSNTVQKRPFNCDGKILILFTPPSETPSGAVVNEMSWAR